MRTGLAVRTTHFLKAARIQTSGANMVSIPAGYLRRASECAQVQRWMTALRANVAWSEHHSLLKCILTGSFLGRLNSIGKHPSHYVSSGLIRHWAGLEGEGNVKIFRDKKNTTCAIICGRQEYGKRREKDAIDRNRRGEVRRHHLAGRRGADLTGRFNGNFDGPGRDKPDFRRRAAVAEDARTDRGLLARIVMTPS